MVMLFVYNNKINRKVLYDQPQPIYKKRIEKQRNDKTNRLNYRTADHKCMDMMEIIFIRTMALVTS